MEKYRIMVKGIVRLGDRYLLVQHWHDDRITDPYQWEFINGQVAFGEEPDKTVIRMIKEQTGLEAVIERIAYTWSYVVGDVHYIGISYICEALTEEVILSEELNAYCFVGMEEFRDYITNEKVLKDIAKAFHV